MIYLEINLIIWEAHRRNCHPQLTTHVPTSTNTDITKWEADIFNAKLNRSLAFQVKFLELGGEYHYSNG